MNGKCYVYWAHLPEHSDMLTQGYVGITTSTVKKRWAAHCAKSRRGKNECYILEYAIRKYGDRIIVETLWEDTKEACMQFEYDLRPEQFLGWNAGIGGTFNRVGVPMSDEQKAKISATLKGRPLAADRKAKISATLQGNQNAKGSVRSDEYREASRVRGKAFRHAPETRRRISETLRRRHTK